MKKIVEMNCNLSIAIRKTSRESIRPKTGYTQYTCGKLHFYACSKLHLKRLLSMFTTKILTVLFFLWLEDLWFYACVTFSLTKCEDRLPILFLYDILYYLLSQLRMFSIEQTHSFYMKSYWHDIKIGLSLMDWILMRQGLFTYVLVTGNLQKLASEGKLMVSWSKGYQKVLLVMSNTQIKSLSEHKM